MNKKFKSDIASSKPLIGTVISLNSAEVIELISECGFDWLWIDDEHGSFSISDLRNMLQAVRNNIPCLIRVPALNEVSIKKTIDLGPAGIIVPMVNTKEEAERAVELVKYPPEGKRSMGLSRASSYGVKFDNYISNANEAVSIVIQAEHITAVKNINSILEVEAIDAVMIGPYDLSASMNLTGQVSHPQVVEAIESIITACKNAGKPFGIFSLSAENAGNYINKGCSLIAAGIDSNLIAKSAKDIVASVKNFIH